MKRARANNNPTRTPESPIWEGEAELMNIKTTTTSHAKLESQGWTKQMIYSNHADALEAAREFVAESLAEGDPCAAHITWELPGADFILWTRTLWYGPVPFFL